MSETQKNEVRANGFRARVTSNPLALALGMLAVIIASTGTAVAVSVSKSAIADPYVAGRAARVDGNGRLFVTGPVAVAGPVRVTPPTAAINIVTAVQTPAPGSVILLTQPTTATVAITRFSVGNPSTNKGYNAEYVVHLWQTGIGSDGNCSSSVVLRDLTWDDVAPGDYHNGDFATPLRVAPVAGKKYCLVAYGRTSNRQQDSGPDVAYVNFSAYAISGSVRTYTAARVPANQPRKTVR